MFLYAGQFAFESADIPPHHFQMWLHYLPHIIIIIIIAAVRKPLLNPLEQAVQEICARHFGVPRAPNLVSYAYDFPWFPLDFGVQCAHVFRASDPPFHVYLLLDCLSIRVPECTILTDIDNLDPKRSPFAAKYISQRVQMCSWLFLPNLIKFPWFLPVFLWKWPFW